MPRRPLLPATALVCCCLGASALSAQRDAWREAPNLLEGAALAYSTDDGATFTSDAPSLLPRTETRVTIELPFALTTAAHSLAATGSATSLELHHDQRSIRALNVVLNGQDLPLPLDSMTFATLPGIDATLLRRGDNLLRVAMTVWNGSRQDTLTFAPTISLVLRHSSELAFRIGPLLGAFDAHAFTLTSRTNLPARMSVYRTGDGEWQGDGIAMRRVGTTEYGLIHRLRIPRVSPEDGGSYIAVVERDGFTVGAPVPTPIDPGALTRFVVVGDSRTNVAQWQAVAAAVAARDPELVIHVGDLVTSGSLVGLLGGLGLVVTALLLCVQDVAADREG